jgi:hypothetical protein
MLNSLSGRVRGLTRALVLLAGLAMPFSAARAGWTEGITFCEDVRQRAVQFGKDWGISDLVLFGCNWPDTAKIGDNPVSYKASGFVWYKGTAVNGDAVKGRREVSGIMTNLGAADAWKIDRLKYGSADDLGIFTQFFSWLGLSLLASLTIGICSAIAGTFLPRGLVNVLASIVMLAAIWALGNNCFGSGWAATGGSIAYLVLAGLAAKAVAAAA